MSQHMVASIFSAVVLLQISTPALVRSYRDHNIKVFNQMDQTIYANVKVHITGWYEDQNPSACVGGRSGWDGLNKLRNSVQVLNNDYVSLTEYSHFGAFPVLALTAETILPGESADLNITRCGSCGISDGALFISSGNASAYDSNPYGIAMNFNNPGEAGLLICTVV